jgi:hypothetical protein
MLFIPENILGILADFYANLFLFGLIFLVIGAYSLNKWWACLIF